MDNRDRKFMRRALKMARRFEGITGPNPTVGAVVVSGDEVVGVGAHRGPGSPHGEVVALNAAGDRAKGADLFVTLEPCSHFGRTPPCTDAILSYEIKRVFIGMRDPNPEVQGGGAEILEEAGLDVEVGVLGDRIERFYEAYKKFVTKKTPFVTIKAALTLDGKIATATRDSKWITSNRARKFVHKLRARSDAVLVGIGTVKADDPLLTVRMVKGEDPIRIVVDSELEIDTNAKLLNEGDSKVIIVAAEGAEGDRATVLEAQGAEIIYLPREGDEIALESLMEELGRRGVMSLLVEGGAKVFTYFIKHDIFDKIYLIYAPKLLTGSDPIGLTVGMGPDRISDAVKLKGLKVRRMGDDFIVEAYR